MLIDPLPLFCLSGTILARLINQRLLRRKAMRVGDSLASQGLESDIELGEKGIVKCVWLPIVRHLTIGMHWGCTPSLEHS